MVLMIEKVDETYLTVFVLVGTLGWPEVQELKAQLNETRDRVALDLHQVRLIGLDAAHFLAAAECDGVELRRVPRFVREWIELEQSTSKG